MRVPVRVRPATRVATGTTAAVALFLLLVVGVMMMVRAGDADEDEHDVAVAGDNTGALDEISTSAVVVLTDDTFEHLTQAGTGATTGDWFVKFYAPWCGHCVSMADAWVKTAEQLAGVVNVAEVDGTKSAALMKRFSVRSFPTIKYFRQGRMYSYSGARTADAFVAFARGGYESAESEPVPGLPTLWTTIEAELVEAKDQTLQIVQRSPLGAFTVAMGGCVVGSLFTFVLFVFIVDPRVNKRAEQELFQRLAAAQQAQAARAGSVAQAQKQSNATMSDDAVESEGEENAAASATGARQRKAARKAN